MTEEVPLTEEEALSIRRRWRAVTEEEPNYDPDYPVRVSTLAALEPIAHEVPRSRWLGGDYDHVYSALITCHGAETNAWSACLLAGDNYLDIRRIVGNSHAIIYLPKES